MAHYRGHFEESDFKPAFHSDSTGYSQAVLVDHTIGSVHTCTHLCELEPGGTLNPHYHAYEEIIYVMFGEVVLTIDGNAYHLAPGAISAIKVGQTHAWHNPGSEPVRWFQAAAPQPKPQGGWQDTFIVKGAQAITSGKPLDLNNTDGNLFSKFGAGDIPPPGDPARETSGAPPGVFLKWLMDEHIGAVHQRLLFIEYQPGVTLGLHDHTYEESYFILTGQVDVQADDEKFTAKAGDVIWTSVGSFHSFENNYDEPVRWVETFSPQPPRENVFRFQKAFPVSK